MSKERDGIFMGGYGSDIFGEQNVARNVEADPVNDHLRDKYMRSYIADGRAKKQFYADFEKDLAQVQTNRIKTWAIAFTAAGFAAMVINPNFTQRRSYYMRKFIPFMSGLIGFQWGRKCESQHVLATMLQLNEHLPLEVKRTL